MPGGDGTGPMGMGPMTGRRAGYCTGYSVPGYTNASVRGFGRGFARGRGFGRGFWRRGYCSYPGPYYRYYGPTPELTQPYVYPEPTKEEEKTYLEEMVKSMEEELKAIKGRLEELSKK